MTLYLYCKWYDQYYEKNERRLALIRLMGMFVVRRKNKWFGVMIDGNGELTDELKDELKDDYEWRVSERESIDEKEYDYGGYRFYINVAKEY